MPMQSNRKLDKETTTRTRTTMQTSRYVRTYVCVYVYKKEQQQNNEPITVSVYSLFCCDKIPASPFQQQPLLDNEITRLLCFSIVTSLTATTQILIHAQHTCTHTHIYMYICSAEICTQ